MGFKGPQFSRNYEPMTGMSWRASYASPKRALCIDLHKAHQDVPSFASFSIDPVPVVDAWESFGSVMFFALKYRGVSNLLAEIERTQTIQEIIETEFALFAELFRGELRPILTGAKWRDDDYDFYRDR